jgi:hypothetical protein
LNNDECSGLIRVKSPCYLILGTKVLAIHSTAAYKKLSADLSNPLIKYTFEFRHARRQKVRDKIKPPSATIFASTFDNSKQIKTIFLQMK